MAAHATPGMVCVKGEGRGSLPSDEAALSDQRRTCPWLEGGEERVCKWQAKQQIRHALQQ